MLVHPAVRRGHVVLLRVESVGRDSGVGGDGGEEVHEYVGDGRAGHGGDGTGKGRQDWVLTRNMSGGQVCEPALHCVGWFAATSSWCEQRCCHRRSDSAC